MPGGKATKVILYFVDSLCDVMLKELCRSCALDAIVIIPPFVPVEAQMILALMVGWTVVMVYQAAEIE
jgi:hypothetical protein